MLITPRYSCIFVRRYCPRNCGYCLAKDVRGDGKFMKPEEWGQALKILEDKGIKFHLILGNELLAYPNCAELVKELQPFWGRYAIYSTFPEPWTTKFLDGCLNQGLYNISGGVDVCPGLATGDYDVDSKSDRVLQWLVYCQKRGVPDVHATTTIHKYNYNKLEPLLDYCTSKNIWMAASMVEYSSDGKHDFYRDYEAMRDWLIPKDELGKFRDTMHDLAVKMRTGRWKMQVPPEYFEELGDREFSQISWHCSKPIIIHIEEDGNLRACNYRGLLKEKHSVFELDDGRLTMEEYVALQQSCTKECPGCSGGGGAWSYWWQAEYWLKGDVEKGDKIFQEHARGHEFSKTIKNKN